MNELRGAPIVFSQLIHLYLNLIQKEVMHYGF